MAFTIMALQFERVAGRLNNAQNKVPSKHGCHLEQGAITMTVNNGQSSEGAGSSLSTSGGASW